MIDRTIVKLTTHEEIAALAALPDPHMEGEGVDLGEWIQWLQGQASNDNSPWLIIAAMGGDKITGYLAACFNDSPPFPQHIWIVNLCVLDMASARSLHDEFLLWREEIGGIRAATYTRNEQVARAMESLGWNRAGSFMEMR